VLTIRLLSIYKSIIFIIFIYALLILLSIYKSIIFINLILLIKIKKFIFYIYFINISKHRGRGGIIKKFPSILNWVYTNLAILAFSCI